MSIPQYVTHTKPSPITTKVALPADPAPPREQLDKLLELGNDAIVQQIIDKWKLPFVIRDGKLIEKLEGSDLWLSKFITRTPSCLELKETARKFAGVDNEVLITGQTGTGKEIIAHVMHGDRKGKFISINCAGLPDTLVESELFGYVRGSFTGATGDREGLLAKAKEGTIFLDEVAELPVQSQAKLLRAIQERTVRRVGGYEDEQISCKIVCATNRNLQEMQTKGTFKEDLYARISTLEIHIPPLSERKDDIISLIMNERGGERVLKEMTKQDIRIEDIDLRYNVRSIQRLVTRFNVIGKVILS